jgi:hypothetical protein
VTSPSLLIFCVFQMPSIAWRTACGVDPQVAAVAHQLAERLGERGVPGLSLGIVRGEIREHPDAPHPLALLRTRRERPRRAAAERRDESRRLMGLTPRLGSREMGGEDATHLKQHLSMAQKARKSRLNVSWSNSSLL